MRGQLCATMAALLYLCSAARADDKVGARAAYIEGTRQYDLADYRAALESFRRAYLKYEDSSFLFNIAQCYRQLGDKAEALRFYKTYLRKVPEAPNADDVRARIEALQRELAASAPAPAPTTSSPPAKLTPTATQSPATTPATMTTVTATAAPAPAHKTPKRWWIWTVVGVVAAGAVATGVAVGVTQSQPRETSFQVRVP